MSVRRPFSFRSFPFLFVLCPFFGAFGEWLSDGETKSFALSSNETFSGGNSIISVNESPFQPTAGRKTNGGKEQFKLEAKNVTIFIPELHFSSQNGVIEMSSFNITADFLEVNSAEGDQQRADSSPKTPPLLPFANEPFSPANSSFGSNLFEYPELVASLNLSLNPCDNFYEFVCDGWMKSNPIDEDKTSANQFQLINNLIEDRVKAILDDRAHFHALPPYDRMMFAMFDACMDNVSRRVAGSNILLKTLKSLKQSRGMRYVTDWLLKVWPVNLFYAVSVGPDMRNTSATILTISPNNLFLLSEKLYIEENLAPKYVAALKQFLRKVLELLYEDDQRQTVFRRANKAADIERRVNAFVEVEVRMALLINGTDKHYDNAYREDSYITLQELQDTLAGTINWPKYLKNILPNEVISRRYSEAIGTVKVRIAEVQLIKKFEKLARSLSGQILSDYMDWKVILSGIGHLDNRFLEAQFELDRVLQGSLARPAQWKECKNVVLGFFPALIERVYIHRHLEVNATKQQLKEMFEDVKTSFHQMLDLNLWMEPKTKSEAFEKLERLNVLIGYMDAIFNETKLKNHFKEYDVHKGQSFPEMAFSLSKLMNHKSFLQLLEPVEVEFSSLVINGFYYPIKNSIVLTGGILQGVFFNATRPIPMNYGSIGVVLAHEITHGFDNNGRLHDQFGNVRNWWQNGTATAFIGQKKCFIDQYNAIQVPGIEGLHVNGNLTQGENIADNGGMRAAFAAMTANLAKGRANGAQRVRGLEQFGPEQLFFINYAFSWCTNQRHEAAVFAALFDSHSPPESRVNVVLGNLPQFAKHFNCPVGSAMNLGSKRCSVW
ncbi:hypothetical protein niasHT_013532 [Heterodera trifolii]|uniref:Uncharacterized protein n=1 Tax=Heterodera trifolii TaxID=157864 RepID=A0ABD2LDU8_9BILA